MGLERRARAHNLMNDNPKRECLTTTRVDGHRVEHAGKSSQTIWRIVKEESKMIQSELDPQCERNNYMLLGVSPNATMR
jgi:hypothetical protein